MDCILEQNLTVEEHLISDNETLKHNNNVTDEIKIEKSESSSDYGEIQFVNCNEDDEYKNVYLIKSVKKENCDEKKVSDVNDSNGIIRKFPKVKIFKNNLEENSFKCYICDKCFKGLKNFKAHLKNHIKVKQYKCDICGHTFRLLSDLKTHMRIHTGEKPFKCINCEHSFAQMANLRAHLKTHTGEKRYKCNVCEYTCIRGASLKDHMRKHTGEKPYQCTFCDCAFAHLNGLKYHLKKHNNVLSDL